MNQFLKSICLLLLASVLTATPALAYAQPQASYKEYGFSSEEQMHQYLRIDRVEFSIEEATHFPSELTHSPSRTLPREWDVNPISVIDELLGNVQNWLVIGEKIFEIISRGKAVANVNTKRLSVLPGQNDWRTMERWQGPVVKHFRADYLNGFGQKVIAQKYTVSYYYGGQVGGKGAFIANATIIPSEINVAKLFTLDSNVEFGDPINMGTVDSPDAAIDMSVQYKTTDVLGIKNQSGTETFSLRGDGQTLHVSSSR